MIRINPLNSTKFLEDFKSSKIYLDLKKDYDLMDVDPNKFNQWYGNRNPREVAGRKIWENEQTYMSLNPFYYLQFLLETNPASIIDIGCGWNIFKKYIPEVVGVDYKHPDGADIVQYYDNTFVENYYQTYDAGFSINGPVCSDPRDLKELHDQLLLFSELIRPGGRGFVSFVKPWNRSFERAMNWLEVNSYNKSSITEDVLIDDVYHTINQGKFKIVCFDSNAFGRASPDGDIKIVFEK